MKGKVDKTLVASVALHVLVIGWGLMPCSARALEAPRNVADTTIRKDDSPKADNPLTLSVNLKGQVFLNDTEIPLDDLVSKLKAIADARGGLDERIFVRGDKKVDYGTVMKVMGRLSAAGFRRVALVTEADQE